MSHENNEYDEDQLIAWLENVNLLFREAEIPPRARPFEAIHLYSQQFNRSVVYGSQLSNTIFKWFYDNTKPGSHKMGYLFTGSYYFDSCFWPIQFPIAFGTHHISLKSTLDSMTESLWESHLSNSTVHMKFISHWVNCCNYAYGLERLKKLNLLSNRAIRFIENAEKELAGSISLINEPRSNAKAILALRMSCEIFLKALLVQERNLSNAELKKYSHNLGETIKECYAITNDTNISSIADHIVIFPDISERYDGEMKDNAVIWQALQVTQTIAAGVINYYSGQSVLSLPDNSKEGICKVRCILYH